MLPRFHGDEIPLSSMLATQEGGLCRGDLCQVYCRSGIFIGEFRFRIIRRWLQLWVILLHAKIIRDTTQEELDRKELPYILPFASCNNTLEKISDEMKLMEVPMFIKPEFWKEMDLHHLPVSMIRERFLALFPNMKIIAVEDLQPGDLCEAYDKKGNRCLCRVLKVEKKKKSFYLEYINSFVATGLKKSCKDGMVIQPVRFSYSFCSEVRLQEKDSQSQITCLDYTPQDIGPIFNVYDTNRDFWGF
jgi:hypothetical protein